MKQENHGKYKRVSSVYFQSGKVQYTHLFGDPRVKTYVVLTTWSPMSRRPAANLMEKEENKNCLKDEGKCICT